ncbi:signal transduction histidine kinase [Deinobacterium chartae]|uniref:histidine kinase n=1 Tax=Deinobacterium chartae TaxID=521158 RepID=A0A841I475_9DEIO|nr:HAMP domain-containing sensor histidine kinase [Deinobacterium chartae]MBB6098705.1 signal transduction histidine kinase [Deinobacterium chartae]
MTAFTLLRPFRATSLRAQVAVVVALLSFVPNLVMVTVLIWPSYQRNAEGAAALFAPLGLWMLCVALLSGGIGYLLSRGLLSPLQHLATDLEALGLRDRLRVGPRAGDPQEVVLLRRSFDELLERLEVEQSRRAAFMATLMHDLKTPLIAANHLLEVLRSTDLPAPERVELADRIIEENKGLLELVRKMVEAHRFEREGVILHRQNTDLRALAALIAARAQPSAQQRGIRLSVSGEGHAWADPRELERALGNLLDNALRYARSRVSLEVSASCLAVIDDGPGLPAPLEELAQPFNAQPVQIAGQSYTAGTGGLGLFIARRIVEAHGGTLQAERAGGYTRLTIRLDTPRNPRVTGVTA